MPAHPSRLALDLWTSGQASPEVGAHVEACTRCRRQLQRDRAGDADFLRRFPDGTALRAAAAGAARPRWLPALALAGGLSGLVVLGISHAAGDEAPATERAKGGAIVELWVQRGAAVESLRGAGPLRTGDRVLVRTTGPGGFLLLVAIEPGARVEPLVADASGRGVAVGPGAQVTLRQGFALEGPPEPALWLAVFGARPTTLAAVERAVADLEARAPAGGRPPDDAALEQLALPGELSWWRVGGAPAP